MSDVLDHRTEADDMAIAAARRAIDGVDRFHRAHRVALDGVTTRKYILRTRCLSTKGALGDLMWTCAARVVG